MTQETRNSIAEAVAALIVFAGAAIFARGVWLAWHPGGWMVSGIAIGSPALFWLYNHVTRQAVARRTGKTN